MWFILAVVNEQQKQFYNWKLTVWVWCYSSYNERTNRLRVYRRLLTNRLLGKAAELCLANSRNNSSNYKIHRVH